MALKMNWTFNDIAKSALELHSTIAHQCRNADTSSSGDSNGFFVLPPPCLLLPPAVYPR